MATTSTKKQKKKKKKRVRRPVSAAVRTTRRETYARRMLTKYELEAAALEALLEKWRAKVTYYNKKHLALDPDWQPPPMRAPNRLYEELRQITLAEAGLRGHVLDKFRKSGIDTFYANCVACGEQVNIRPLLTEQDPGRRNGTALRRDCTGKRRTKPSPATRG